MTYISRREELFGMPTVGRAVTATLYVSPNGDNSNGSSWAKAYTTLQGALTAASTDANECTLLLLGVNTGPANHYDIDTTGDPTWTGNYIIKGTHRTWQKIMNDHGSATSVMKFTGYVSLIDVNINLGTTNNGVIVTKGAFRVSHCQFVGEDLTAERTALHIDGASTLKHGKLHEVSFRGDNEFMTGMLVDNCCCSLFERIQIHNCLKGIQIVNAGSVDNLFNVVDIGGCNATVAVEGTDGIGFDIDAGVGQHLYDVSFHSNTINVDDEAGGHLFQDIKGEFPIAVLPTGTDTTGLVINLGDTIYGGDTELIPAAGGIAPTKPFKVLSYILSSSTDKDMRINFSADSGVTNFAEYIGAALKKDKASGTGDATDFIFNVGTRISADGLSSEGAGDTCAIWLEIQEI